MCRVGTYYFLHQQLAQNFKRHYLETRFLDLLHSTQKGQCTHTLNKVDYADSGQYNNLQPVNYILLAMVFSDEIQWLTPRIVHVYGLQQPS